jgi:short subunit dehydrogenase-like uncharacterized protein
MGEKAGKDLSKTPIIIAELGNEQSLIDMASKAKVIVNCAGPYRFYGEQVVKACISQGTHHVDVSGEPQYMEKMQLDYNEAAQEKGVFVVSACGFDSIPADMGVLFLEEKFGGCVNFVETYLRSWSTLKQPGPGASIHYGTWESAIYGLAHASELRGLRSKLFKTRLPKFEPVLRSRSIVHKSSYVNDQFCLPFPGSDRSVVMRSQRYFFDAEKKRPIQMKAYVAFDSILALIGVIFVGMVFGILARFAFGRKLLRSYPKFFSFGFVDHQGPSEENMENTKFELVFNGQGWKEKLAEGTDQYTEPMNKKMVVKVAGTNPGYGATCVALLLSATTILKESAKMPGKGGVLPPGAAFAKTSIITELCKNGFTFEVVKEEEK